MGLPFTILGLLPLGDSPGHPAQPIHSVHPGCPPGVQAVQACSWLDFWAVSGTGMDGPTGAWVVVAHHHPPRGAVGSHSGPEAGSPPRAGPVTFLALFGTAAHRTPPSGSCHSLGQALGRALGRPGHRRDSRTRVSSRWALSHLWSGQSGDRGRPHLLDPVSCRGGHVLQEHRGDSFGAASQIQSPIAGDCWYLIP